MTDKEALQAFKQGKGLDQPTTRRLLRAGLIEARDVTNMDSPQGEREYLATFITEKGKRLLES